MGQRVSRPGHGAHPNGPEVAQTGVKGINGGKVGHTDRPTGRARFGAKPLKAVGVKGVAELKPAARPGGELGGPGLRNADDAAAMQTEHPLVGAGDDAVSTGAVQCDPPQRLGHVDRNQGVWRQLPYCVMKGLPVQPKAVVKADQRDLHQACLGIEQRQQVGGVEGACARSPNLDGRLRGRRQPGRGPRWKVKVVDHHLIRVLQIQGAGQQVVGLGTARAERDLIRREPQPLCADLAALRQHGKVTVAPTHALLLVVPVGLQRVLHAQRWNALRRTVEVVHPSQAGEVACA